MITWIVVVWDLCCLKTWGVWIRGTKFIFLYVECDNWWRWWHIDEMMLMFMIMLIGDDVDVYDNVIWDYVDVDVYDNVDMRWCWCFMIMLRFAGLFFFRKKKLNAVRSIFSVWRFNKIIGPKMHFKLDPNCQPKPLKNLISKA